MDHDTPEKTTRTDPPPEKRSDGIRKLLQGDVMKEVFGKADESASPVNVIDFPAPRGEGTVTPSNSEHQGAR